MPQEDLPAPVAQLRTSIVAAAAACDYARLEELALAGPAQFTFSFGAEGSPADYWQRLEQAGDEAPLRHLVEILNLPFRRIEPAGQVQYVWPSAFGYPNWESTPQEAKDALTPLYSQDELRGFARFGSYAGHRVAISPDGEWLFFVGGD